MFKKFRIKNFKCFVDNEFELGKITVFTGVNAVGKSSVIQALLLFIHAAKNEKKYLDAREILGIDIGSPKNLVAQNLIDIGAPDFTLQLDEILAEFFIDKESGLNLSVSCSKLSEDILLSYLNTERVGPRMYYRAGGEDRFLYDGSNTVYLMERADNLNLQIPKNLIVDDTSGKFSYQVECWMSLILGNVQLDKKINTANATAELKIKNDFVEEAVSPTLTGFGISYELSVIVAGLWMAAKGNGILIVENPEAHLHPSAQSLIGKFLAIVSTTGIQVIVETHSEHVIDGLRIQMYRMQQEKDVKINYLSNDEGNVKISRLYIEDDGELSDWPDGFFDQKRLDLRELFTLRRANEDM